MKFDSLLQSLSDTLGMSPLTLNEHGVISLEFEGRYRITLEPDPKGDFLHLYSPLCRIPEAGAARQSLYEALLTANGFGRGTNGANFAIDEVNAEVILGRRFDIESVQVQELITALSSQLTVLEHWQEHLPELLHAAVPSSEVSFDSSAHFLRA